KVVAGRVKNLFPPPLLPRPSPPAVIHESPPPRAPVASEAARPKRVIRIRGGVIISQDGRSVSFAKQCEVCGHKESGRSTAAIRAGMTRITFFCRPCRKSRTVELQGVC